MIVLYKKKQLVVLIFLGTLLFLRCHNKNPETDTYSILSIVTKELSFKFSIFIPALPYDISTADSIVIMKKQQEIVKSFEGKKQIIAIIPHSTPAYLEDFDISTLSNDFQILLVTKTF